MASAPAPAPTAPAPSAPALWARLLERSKNNASLRTVLELLTLEREDGAELVLVARTPSERDAASARKSAIENAARDMTGRSVRVTIKLAGGEAAPRTPSTPAVDAAAYAQAQASPLVRRAIELFDARLVDVQDDT